MQPQRWSFSGHLILAVSLALLWLFMASLWVPISMETVGYYRDVNLLQELKPRALVNTVATLLGLSNWGFNALKVFSLFIWLTLILLSLSQKILAPAEHNSRWVFIRYLALSFIFAWSTVTFMTYGGVAILDAIPYCLVLIATLICLNIGPRSWLACLLVTILLLSAVLAHEKSLFDIAILGIWFSWRWGIFKAFRFFLPTAVSCLLFLWLVQNKGTSGLSALNYLAILHSGIEFMKVHSFSLLAVIFGGGALWGVYAIASYYFIAGSHSGFEILKRILLSVVLLLICFAPLLISWDTNRLVDLIWLPTFLMLMQLPEKNWAGENLFVSCALAMLCLAQLFVPPLLRTNDLVFAFNSYAAPFAQKFKRDNFNRESLIQAGESLSFTKDGLGSRCLVLDGWNDQEPWGLWSKNLGKVSFGNLGAGIQSIEVTAKALVGPKQPTQSIMVFINQVPSQTITLNSLELNTFTITLPKPTKPGEPLDLWFQINQPSTPIQAGISTNDDRTLGLGLIKIDFIGADKKN